MTDRTPTVVKLEALAPEVFDLCDDVAQQTLACQIDLDLECYRAVEAARDGAPLAVVLGHIPSAHPAAGEAQRRLEAVWRRQQPG